MEEFWKCFLKGEIFPENRHFGVVSTGLYVTDLQVTGFDLANPSFLRKAYLSEKRSQWSEKVPTVCSPWNRLFVRLTVSAVETPKVTQISIIIGGC